MKTTHLPKPPAAWLLLLSMLLPSTLHAQDTLYWIGSQDNLWRHANNWSFTSGGIGGAGIPGSTTTVVFDSGSLQNCYLDTVEYVSNVLLNSTDEVTLYIMSQAGSFTCSGNITIRNGTFYTSDSIINIGGNLTINEISDEYGDGLFFDSSKYVTVWDTFTVDGGEFYGLYAYFDDTDQSLWLKGPINLIGGSFTPPWNLYVYHDLIDTLGVFNVGRNTYFGDTLTVYENYFNNVTLGDSAFVTLMSPISMPGYLVLNPYSRLYIKAYGNPDIDIPWIVGFGGIYADSTAGIIYDDSLNLQPVVYAVVLNDTGSFDVPFVTMDNKKVPMDYTVEVPGSIGGTGLMFGGYATNSANNPNNLPYPTQIASLFESMNLNSLYAVDRYWLFGIMDASPPADGKLVLHYSTDDIGGANILDEARLVALHFDGSQFDVVKGVVDTVAHSFTLDSVSGSLNFYFLYDSAALPLLMPPNISPQVICSDTTQMFTFSNVVALVDGNQIEWATNSAFTGSTIVNSPATITVTVSAGAMDSIWIRSKDSVSGNVSSAVVTTATVNILPTASITPMDTFVLQGQWVTLTTSGGTAYLWAGLDASGSTITVTPESDSTYYTVIVSNANGCADTLSALVRAMPFPIITDTNYRDTINSGDSTLIIVYSTDPSTFIYWRRDDSANVSGPLYGTGNHIKEPLVNKTARYQTVHYKMYGSAHGYYAEPAEDSVTLPPNESIYLSITPVDSAITACAIDTFRLVIARSDSASSAPGYFTINLAFNYPLDSFRLINGSGFKDSISVLRDSIYITTTSQFANDTDTLAYSFIIPCPYIPDSTENIQLTEVISLTDTSGNPLSDTALYIIDGAETDSIISSLNFPFLNITSINGRNDTLAYGLDTISTLYENKGNGNFDGEIEFSSPFTCDTSGVKIEALILTVEGKSPVVIDTPHSPYYFPPEEIPAGDSFTIQEVDSGIGCITGGCAVNFNMRWGCNDSLCKSNSTTINLVKASVPGNLGVYRVLPLPTPGDGNQAPWDASCTGAYTSWEYMIRNDLPVPVYNLAIRLTNPDITSYTYIVTDSVRMDTTLSGTGFFNTQKIDSLPHAPVFDTLKATSFTGDSPTACFDLLIADSLTPISGYSDTLPVLLPGQMILFKFQTYRCCPNDNAFNSGILFNQWEISVSAQNACGGLASSDGQLQGTFVSGTDTTLTYEAIFNGGDNYISADYLQPPNLALTQTISTVASSTISGLFGGGCGSPKPVYIANNTFTLDQYNAELFSSMGTTSGGVITGGANPHGQFMIVMVNDANMQVDPQFSPIITDGYTRWNPIASDTFWSSTLDTFIFDLDSLGAITDNSASFITFFISSYIQFEVQGCCNSSNTPSTQHLTVYTYFNPAGSCTSCWIPLSEVSQLFTLLCPGCVTPGMISGTTLTRVNLGFKDSNNDGIPDSNALIPIGPGYPWLNQDTLPGDRVALDKSMVGDTLLALTNAFFEDGEDTLGGFKYTTWQNYWTDSSCTDWTHDSTPILAWLYIEETLVDDSVLGAHCISSMLQYTPDSGAVITDTISIDTIIRIAADTNVLIYKISAWDLDPSVRFMPNDQFQLTQLFTIGRNPAVVTALQADVHTMLTEMPLNDFPLYSNYTPASNLIGIAAHCPATPLLYYCGDTASGTNEVYPIKDSISMSQPNNTSCNYLDSVFVAYYISDGMANSPIYSNIFPYEYRMMPGIDTASYQRGPMSATGVPVTLHLPVPHDFSASVDLVATYCYAYNSDSLFKSVAGQNSAADILPSGTVSGDTDINAYVTDSVTYSPPFQNLHLNTGTDTYFVTKPVLLLGDEHFVQVFYYHFYPRCDSAIQSKDSIPTDSIYVLIPGLDSAHLGGNDTIGNPKPYDNGACCFTFTLPEDTFIPATIDTPPQFYGSYINWTVTLSYSAPGVIPYMILFIPEQLADSLGVDSVGSPTCGTPLMDTVISDSIAYLRYRVPYTSGEEQNFCIGIHLTHCSDSVNIPFYYSWSCTGLPDSLPPGHNKCSIPDTLMLRAALPLINLAASVIVPPSPYKTCSPITLQPCLSNASVGGVGNFIDSIILPDTIVLDASSVVLKVGGTPYPVADSLIQGYPSGNNVLWVFDTRQMTALDSTSSKLGAGGLTNTSPLMCMTFNLIPKCNTTVIPQSKFTFSGISYCGAVDTVSVVLDSIPVTINGCGPFDSIYGASFCSATFAEVSASGVNSPFSYYWSNDSTTPAIYNLTPGWYYVTVTDSSGCAAKDSIQLKAVHPGPAVTITTSNGTDIKCSSADTMTLTAHTEGVLNSYNWSNGAYTDSTKITAAGTYVVTVTPLFGLFGCPSMDSITITTEGAWSLIIETDSSNSCNGSAKATDLSGGVPPYGYHWSTGGTTDSIGGLAPGTYYLTVTDSIGCERTDDATIGNNMTNPYGDTIVSGDSIWTTPHQLGGNLVIEPGASLTISSLVEMASTAKIIVEQNATLIIDSGTITGLCDSLWDGIEVWGTSSSEQGRMAAHPPLSASSNQGFIYVLNLSTIENAKRGILLAKSNTNGSVDLTTTGGQIEAENSTFRNNGQDIAFYPYTNTVIKDTIVPVYNIRIILDGDTIYFGSSYDTTYDTILYQYDYIDRCLFVTTNNYNFNAGNLTHIYMRGINDLPIKNSTFIDQATGGEELEGIGIQSVDANFTATTNSFVDLGYGIYPMGTGIATPNIVIQSDTFNNNVVGIYNQGSNFINVLQNTFNVSQNGFLAIPGVGFVTLGIYNCANTNFRIEENNTTFTYNENDLYEAGIYNVATSASYNLVYKNSFTGAGVNFIGIPNSKDNSRLYIQCDTFSGDMDNIDILSGNIAYTQGDCNSSGTGGADNGFATDCDNSNHAQIFANPGSGSMIYSYDRGYEPDTNCVVDAYLQFHPCTVVPEGGSTCPSNIVSPPCGLFCLLPQIDTLTLAINNEYSLLDNGKTAAYLGMIKDTGIANNVIFDTLRNVNGMLSDDVLLLLMHRAPTVDSVSSGLELVCSAAADTEKLAALLIQNAPLSNVVMNEVSLLNPPLPPDSLIKLNQYQDSTSVRQSIVDSIDELKAHKQYDYVLLAGYAATDSSYSLAQLEDSLANETDVYLQLMLADLYMADTEYAAAKAIYDSLPIFTNGIGEIQALRKIEIVFYQNSWDWTDMANDESDAYYYHSAINFIAHADTSIAAIQAQVILNVAFGDSIACILEYKIEGGFGKTGPAKSSETTSIQTIDNSSQFSVYPNPAENQLVIEYSFGNDSLNNNGFILYDLLGDLLLNKQLDGRGKAILDISNIPDGIYLYEFKRQNVIVKTGKLSVIK